MTGYHRKSGDHLNGCGIYKPPDQQDGGYTFTDIHHTHDYSCFPADHPPGVGCPGIAIAQPPDVLARL